MIKSLETEAHYLCYTLVFPRTSLVRLFVPDYEQRIDVSLDFHSQHALFLSPLLSMIYRDFLPLKLTFSGLNTHTRTHTLTLFRQKLFLYSILLTLSLLKCNIYDSISLHFAFSIFLACFMCSRGCCSRGWLMKQAKKHDLHSISTPSLLASCCLP